MQVQVQQGDIAQFKADAVIVNLFEGVTSPGGGTGAVDKALDGAISSELKGGAFKGKLGETLVLPTYGKLPARYVIIVGLGKQEKTGPLELRRASAAAIKACAKLKIKSAGTLLNGAGIGGWDASQAARLLAEGALLGSYQFTLRKGKKTSDNGKEDPDKKDDEKSDFETLTIVENSGDKLKDIEAGLRFAKVIAEHTNLARDWVNDSANNVTPTFLKEQAEAIPGVSVTVLDAKKIQDLGMGLLHAVSKGSYEPPYLIHIAYKPAGAKRKIAMVGKGITFDSGGLSLKPPAGQETMKMDMAGAAAVIATMKAISELKDLDVEVHGFVPTCENMPSGRSDRPGDIAISMNGKTVEINNTDAEGRLILADALTYAQRETAPDEIIDLATLTGACIVALGKAAAGIMGNEELIDRIRTAGDAAGEKYWPLPLYDEYKSYLKSDVADLINAGAKGEAGSSAGGMFLKEFIENDTPWVHLDIAGPAWVSGDQPEIPKGGSGFGVRTLLYYLYGLN